MPAPNSSALNNAKVLVVDIPGDDIDYIAAMKCVEADYKIGLYSQAFSMLRLAFGKNKIHPADYFNYGLFRPSLSRREKNEYLSYTSIWNLNSRLTPKNRSSFSNLITDKLLSGQLMKECGIPTSVTKAVYSSDQSYRFIKTLGTAQEIHAFITDKSNLPLFAKPVHGSRSLGGVSIVGCSRDRSDVTLGNGRKTSAIALANEITSHYKKGYLFQELLVQPPEIEKIVGKTASTIRIVTVQSDIGPQVLYGIWKQPQKGSMVDSGSTSGSAISLIDIDTGRIIRSQGGNNLTGGSIENSFTTGAPIIGFKIPYWTEIMRLVVSAHDLFTDHGILGWDIIITTKGPIINEVNANPLHLTYQRAADRGFLNADIIPKLENAETEIKRKAALRTKSMEAFSMSLFYGLSIGRKPKQEPKPHNVFLTEVSESSIDVATAMNKAKKDHKRGHYSQAFEMIKLATGKNKISPEIYFSHALFRHSISKSEKRAFVSRVSSTLLNRQMAPEELSNMDALMEDKLLSGLLLQGCGFPVTQNKAVYLPDREFGFLPSLKTVADINEFITTKANLPLFGKPLYGSRSLGGVSVIDCTEDGVKVTLGNGQQMDAQVLAKEITKHHARGYLFQELLMQSAHVQEFVGKTAATLKISTVNTEKRPELLYAVWKQPAPGQMIDGGGAGTSGLAEVDISTGKIVRIQENNLLYGRAISHSVTTGAPMMGMDIPYWKESVELALSAHNLFPDHGILGWDIVLTTRGPVINEVNSNTGHIIIQLASDQGLWNPERRPILENGIAEINRKLASHRAGIKKPGRFSLKRHA